MKGPGWGKRVLETVVAVNAAILILVLVAPVPADATHGITFSESRTRYVDGNWVEADFRHLGCDTANRDRRGYMTLFFGAPVSVGGQYGVTRFAGGDDVLLVGTSNGVSNSIKNFAIGFSNCSVGSSDYIIVGIATSNCNLGGAEKECSIGGPSDTWIRGHGAALAQMVNGVATWITQNGYGNRVQVRGALDMEPSWSTPGKADLWIHGYDFDGPNNYPYLANYSADGCPTARIYNSTANTACSVNGFDLFWMRHLTEGHQSLEFPQVYYGVNAIQWLRIEEYSNHGTTGSLFFLGAMGSPGTDNDTAHKAHQALWTELNQPSPASGHNPNHAAQAVANATLALGRLAGFHDH